MIIFNTKLVRILTLGFIKIGGVTAFPFIILTDNYLEDRDKRPEVFKQLLNHEKIHIQQQKELFIIGFYLLYLLNFMYNFFILDMSYAFAYENIIFEKEAYKHQDNPEYLSTRKRNAWLKTA